MNLLTLEIGKENSANVAFINDDKDTMFSISNFTAKEQQKKLLKPEIMTLFNQFISEQDLNNKIGALYNTMFKDFQKGGNQKLIQYYMKELLSYMKYGELRAFVDRVGMKTPQNLKEHFNYDNEKNAIESRDQTYLQDEFLDLMTVVIASKILIPLTNLIIVEYSHESMYILLRNAYPEFLELEPMERLTRFVESHIQKTSGGEENRVRISTMVDNVGSTELTDYVMGTLFFKMFPVYETIKNPPNHSNLIGAMYYVVSNIFNGTKKSEHRFTVKGPSSTGDSDSEQSIFETYRQATPYSPGKVEVMRKPYRDIYRLAKDFGINDFDLLDKINRMAEPLLDSTKLLHKFTIYLTKITMTKFVNGIPFDSPESYTVLEREQVVNMLVVFTCLALENNHKNIAKYFLMEPDQSPTTGRITKAVRVASISRKEVEICESHYSIFVKKANGAKYADKVNDITDSLNIGYYNYLLEEPYRDVEEIFMSQTPTIRDDFSNFIRFIKEF